MQRGVLGTAKFDFKLKLGRCQHFALVQRLT
ncbi:hypothetical protein BCAR13_70029 [Paraburkholderia caribensis]|nr:hypothetical protein BCAR13_70029 [Paraburkholderia caribensis]